MDILCIRFSKKGITLEPFAQVSHKLCHAHLHIIWIICSKFHMDDIKTVVGV